MNNQQLIQVQRAIEEFFYKVRVNIALYNIMQSSEYASFRKQMKLAIENQILYFAKIEKVNQVVGTQKLEEWEENIILLFPYLQQFIDQQDFRKHLQYSSAKGAEAANNVLGLDQDYNVNQRVGSTLDQRVPISMQQIDKTTIDWITKTIRRAMKEGLSSYDTAKLLRDEAHNQAIMRSEIIAEQEAAWALGATQLDVYIKSGVEKKKLITSRDEAVCLICIADENAGEIDIKEKFPSGSVTTPIHIHCRCFLVPVMPKIVPLQVPE